MDIHPLWFFCILVRLTLICLIIYLNKKKNVKLNMICGSVLLLMGVGFIYKGFVGSNNEIQIKKVFWHETRYVHGMLYLLSYYYLINKNIKMTGLVLSLDLIFSFLYRFISGK